MSKHHDSPKPFRRRGIFSYTTANVVSASATLVVSLTTRAMVGPEAFGGYFIAISVAAYLGLLNIPFNATIDVDVPLRLGRQPTREVSRLLSGVYAVMIVCVAFEAMALAIAGRSFSSSTSAQAAFVAVAAALPFDSLSQSDWLVLKGFNHFDLILRRTLLVTAAYSATYLGLTAWFGIGGFLWAVFVTALLRFMVYRHAARRLVSLRWLPLDRWRGTIAAVRRGGGAISIYRVAQLAMESVDRLLVAKYMGVRAVGVYSLAVAISGALKLVPRSIGGGILPEYLRRSSSQSTKEAATEAARVNGVVMWTTCIFGLAGVSALEGIVPVLLPAYKDAIRPGQLLIIAEVFQQARFGPSSYLFGSSSRLPLIVASLVGCVIAAGGGTIAARADTLSGVASVSIVAYLLSYGLLLWLSNLPSPRTLLGPAVFSGAIVGVAVLVAATAGAIPLVAYSVVLGGVALDSLRRALRGPADGVLGP